MEAAFGDFEPFGVRGPSWKMRCQRYTMNDERCKMKLDIIASIRNPYSEIVSSRIINHRVQLQVIQMSDVIAVLILILYRA